MFVLPYLEYDPSLCLVACQRGIPAGYILGTHDTTLFAHRVEQYPYPALRMKYAQSMSTVSQLETDLPKNVAPAC